VSKGPFSGRIARSFRASVGEVVFGMEDGTVSILGLVLGVAASAPSSSIVLLAGASGAVAASVSMMAGTFLEVESVRDAAAIHVSQHEEAIRLGPAEATDCLVDRLAEAGLRQSSLDSIRSDVESDPGILRRLETAVTGHPAPPPRESILAHSLWMFASDLFAGLTPVIPFALLPLATARVVSVAATLVLLLVLGIGRARLGRRPTVRTVLETMAIGALAALAGILVGRLLPPV
jgi:vacuolar iron transporter family protein